MISAEGIEVYLKPYGSDGVSLKYPEWELPLDDDYGSHYQRCSIPHTGEHLTAVIRFNEDFDMYTASCGHIGIKSNWAKARLRRGWYMVVQRSHVAGQVCVADHGPNERKLYIPDVTEGDGENDGENHEANDNFTTEYHANPNPGTILISVQRGHVDWQDTGSSVKNCSTLGPSNPGKPRPWASGSFKRLNSTNGLNYLFEFRPMTHGRLVDIEDATRFKDGNAGLNEEEIYDTDRYKLIHDHDYSKVLNETAEKQRRMREEYHNQGKKKPEEDSDYHTTSPLKVPVTCNCPPKTHAIPKRTTNSTSERTDDGSSTRTRRESPNRKRVAETSDYDGRILDPDKTHGSIKGNTANEVVAKTCNRCSRFKRPPRGKKFAWRKRCRKWMYVHPHAPNSDSQEKAQDQDEEEEEASANTTDSAVACVSNDQRQDRDQDDEEQVPTNPEKPIASAETVGLDDTTVITTSILEKNGSDDTVSKLCSETTAMVQHENEGSKLPTGAAAQERTEEVQPQQTNRPGPLGAERRGDSTNKRQASSENLVVMQKRSRIDVDLTLDEEDDDDLVVMKESKAAGRHQQSTTTPQHVITKALQEELEDIECQQRILRLERRKMQVKRELAERQDGRAKPVSVKDEIKLED